MEKPALKNGGVGTSLLARTRAVGLPRRSLPAGAFPPALFAIFLLVLGSACDHRKPQAEQTEAPPPPVTSVLSYSCVLAPGEGLGILSVLHQATLAEEKDRLLIQATGPDAQLGFRVTAEGRHAVSLDITSPGETVLELFYEVRNIYQDPTQPFSAEHVLSAPLKSGRNQLLLLIDHPKFSGGVRLDPGQLPGEYSLHSLQVFSNVAVSFVQQATPQADLGAGFNESTKIFFSAKTNGGWGMIEALNDAQLAPGQNGLTVKATGTDPQLLLPEFDLSGPPIVKVVIVSPAATILQIFSRTKSGLDYHEERSAREPLKPGENTVYLKMPMSDASGVLRLDPGAVAGNYLLKELEVRASTQLAQ